MTTKNKLRIAIVISVIFFVLAVLTFSNLAADTASGHQPNKFEVTFTITYNTATLAEAAELEKRIIKEHDSACKIETTMKQVSSYLTLSSRYYIGDTIRTHPVPYYQGIR